MFHEDRTIIWQIVEATTNVSVTDFKKINWKLLFTFYLKSKK